VQDADSLKEVVASTIDDTVKLHTLIDLCWIYRNSNIDSALKYNDKAYALAEKLGLKNEIVKIIQFKGVIYRNLGEYPKALEYYFNVLKAYEELDDSEGIGFAYQAIGDIYRYLKNTELCKEYTLKGLKYLEAVNNLSGIAYCYYSLGSALMEEVEYDKALDYLTECLKIREGLNEKRGTATAKSGIGRVYFFQKKYAQSLEYFNQTLAIYNSLSDYMGASRALSYRSMVFLAMNDYKNAIKDLSQSIEYAKKIGNKPVLRDNYETLSKCYVSLSNYKKAYQYYQIFILYKDSVANEDKRFEVSMLEIKSEQEKQEKESIRKEMQFQKTESRQKIVISISTSALILMLVIAFVLIRANRREVLANRLLEHQKQEIKSQAEELQKINVELSKLSIVASKTDNVIVICDEFGNFEWANAAYERVYGHSLDYYIEHHEKNIFKMLKSGLLLDIDEKIKNKEIISYKFKPFAYKDVWMQGNLTPIYDEKGNVSKYIIIDIDISNIVRAEATIQEQNEKILQQNEELRAQAEQLQTTNERLIEMDNFKQDLTSMIVHDLKTPLSLIMSTSDIKCTKVAGTQMLNLVMNILDVQKYEETKMFVNSKSVVAKKVANKAIEQILFLANQKCISIVNSIPDNIGIFADIEITERIFVNILTNAIKHTPLNGNIKIEASQSENHAFNKIMITDSGEGIPPDKMHLLFRKFGQIVSKKSGGIRSTGIGLTFCKIAVEAHGGTIDVISRVGVGTTFWFILPASKIEVSDQQTVDAISSEEKFELTHEEKEHLKSFCEKLKGLMVYEYSNVKEIIDRIDFDDHSNIKKWKEKMNIAISTGNEEKYNELIDV
jgi:PAS domain S-box-containing protein